MVGEFVLSESAGGRRMALLQRVILKGFKSIKEMDLELRPLNVLIGANGAGKSNLVSFFKMLNEMMGERLQQYIGTAGRSQSLLYYGPKVTPQLEAQLEFETDNGLNTYYLRLFHAAGDTLVFAEETLSFLQSGWAGNPKVDSLGAGHQETRIGDAANRDEPMAKVFRYLLNHCRVYHFHDTSATARVRQYCYIGDNRWLMPDAGNLAAFLYRLQKQDQGATYHRILSTVRLVAPFFHDFALEPTGPRDKDIILNWQERESDQIFGPHQLSDGTLRAICLVTLLLQPETELPDLIIVDEPELGLHPYALNVVASLFKKVSHRSQVLVSTQSSSFLDSFEPGDVVVVNREGKESVFARPDPSALQAWLDEYSLGEVWEKNVIGGGPH
jgi:predicted ATPase